MVARMVSLQDNTGSFQMEVVQSASDFEPGMGISDEKRHQEAHGSVDVNCDSTDVLSLPYTLLYSQVVLNL
jgi:hypothetical protein